MICLLLLAGCGSGGSSSSTGEAPAAGVSEGVFLDAPVAGLYYQTESLDGYTGTNGVFRYRDGETVAFYLHNLLLGEAMADAVLTPLDIVPGAKDETHPKVTNLCILLQSLDEDGNPDNGIVLSEMVHFAVEGRTIDFNQPTAEFIADPALLGLLQELNASGAFTDGNSRELCTVEQARSHFRASLADLDRDGDGFSPDQGDCNDNDDGVNPQIADVCGDGADQDCSGADAICAEGEGEFESSLRALINDYREQNSRGRLAVDNLLNDLAREHSENMQASGVMSHDGFNDRYNRSGYRTCVENVGWGYSTPQAMFEGWRGSSGHNANMLNGGIGWAGISRVGSYITFFACGD
ncbi:MAG: CAP domain-containing protein [Syntrophotaleaceae bacterium]